MDTPEEWTVLDGPARGQIHVKYSKQAVDLGGVWYRRINQAGRCYWVERSAYFKDRAAIERAQEKAFGTDLTVRGVPGFEMTENELRARHRARDKQPDD